MANVIENATELGAHEIIANTATGNHGALRVLSHLGFQLSPNTETGRVEAGLELSPPTITRAHISPLSAPPEQP